MAEAGGGGGAGDSDLASEIKNLKVTVNGDDADNDNGRCKEFETKTAIQRQHPCGNCGKETRRSCSNCRKEFYCSVDCQKAQIRKHKLICFPAEEEIGVGVRGCGDEPRGFWVATRNIEQGERIFKDYPLVIWPGAADMNPGEQVCLGCHKILKDYVMESDLRKCGNCKWPVCGETCAESEIHAKGFARECPALYRMPFEKAVCKPIDGIIHGIHYAYATVGLIRLQGLRKFDPTKWEQLLNLYIPDSGFNDAHEMVSKDNNMETDEEKKTCSRVLAATKFHKRCPYFPSKEKSERVIYDKETRVEISCMANCVASKIPTTENKNNGDDEHGIVIIAGKRILKGERLTIAFEDFPIWEGTKRRRQIQKLILDNVGVPCGVPCECARCVDPTEFGTNVSAIKCTQCIPGHLFPLNPLDDNSNWKCNSIPCSVVIAGSVVDKIVDRIRMEADTLDALKVLELPGTTEGDLGQNFPLMDAVQNFVDKYEKILNPQHYIILNLQESSIWSTTWELMMKGRRAKNIPGLNFQINRLRSISEMHLDLANKLFPQYDKHHFNAHFVLGMNSFLLAHHAVQDGGSIDDVLNLLKAFVSHKSQAFDFKLKKWLPIPDEYRRLEGFMETAYDMAIDLCNETPGYSVIPDKIIEFVKTLENE